MRIAVILAGLAFIGISYATQREPAAQVMQRSIEIDFKDAPEVKFELKNTKDVWAKMQLSRSIKFRIIGIQPRDGQRFNLELQNQTEFVNRVYLTNANPVIIPPMTQGIVTFAYNDGWQLE